MILFKTDRLIVQRFTAADSQYFFDLNGDERVMQFIRPAKSRQDSDAFLAENIRFYSDDSILGRFAVFAKNDGAFIGTFSFLYLSGEADFHLGYALVPAAWGKGYATELVRAGLPYFFGRTGRDTVFAITVAANTASRHVLQKAGFRFKEEVTENGKPVEVFYINRNLGGSGEIQEV